MTGVHRCTPVYSVTMSAVRSRAGTRPYLPGPTYQGHIVLQDPIYGLQEAILTLFDPIYGLQEAIWTHLTLYMASRRLYDPGYLYIWLPGGYMTLGTSRYSLQEAIWTLVLLDIASRRLYGPWYF